MPTAARGAGHSTLIKSHLINFPVVEPAQPGRTQDKEQAQEVRRAVNRGALLGEARVDKAQRCNSAKWACERRGTSATARASLAATGVCAAEERVRVK